MWSAWSDAWHLYWSMDGVWLRRMHGKESGWMGAGDGAGLSLEQACHEIGQSQRRWQRPRVSVWLSGSMARPFVIGPVQGLKSQAEALQLARGRAQSSLGLGSDCHAVLESWPGRQTVRAVAMERARLEELQAHTSAERICVRSIRPAWSLALQRHCKAWNGADHLAVLEPDAATVLGDGEDGRPVAMSQLALGQGLELGRLLLAAGPLQGVCRTAVLKMNPTSTHDRGTDVGLWSYEP